MKLDYRTKRNLLPKHLEAQVERFIGVLETYNRKLPHPRSKKNYPYLRFFYKNFILDQNSRSLEVSLPTYQKIAKLANAQFPVKTFWNLCIDGRVLPILAHGASAGVGNSLRVPGGMLREFIRGKDGHLMLDINSDYAFLLKRALLEAKGNNILAEVFDSHIGCAARASEEELKGKSARDSGLLADVSHKMQMAQAAKNFVEQTFNGEKKLMVILTSFNPHAGFMYMGLETKDALLYVYKRGNAYTQEILKNLSAIDRIISTEDLVLEKDTKSVFEKYKRNLDWKKNYVHSAQVFWEAIDKMKTKMIPIIEKKLKQVYPNLAKGDSFSRQELEERTMLLLTNAYSGYLHNLERKTRKRQGHETSDHIHLYPYGMHEEEGVKVYEGGHPPYKISMFVVFSFEEKELPSSVGLASTLVRQNRKQARVFDLSGNFPDVQEFSQAAVPIIVAEIVRDFLSDKDWHSLALVDWKDLPESWDKMSEDEFYEYLHGKGIAHFGVAVSLNNLRRKMVALYDIHSIVSSRLVEQYLFALPVIASRNRRIRFVVPFVKLGFN